MLPWRRLTLLCFLALSCAPGTDPPPVSDTDGDGVLDAHEGFEDADEDGVANHLDEDSDGDGLLDAEERGDDDPLTLPFDTDGDGTPDMLDLDSDGNGIPDADERFRSRPRSDADGDGLLDAHDLDDDGDGVPDLLEMALVGGDLDTDGDGDPDRYDTDSDNDGVPDAVEGAPRLQDTLPDDDADGTPDLRDDDSDGDGVPDTVEGAPFDAPPDTDGDGRADYRDRDSDNDGIADLEDQDRLSADSDGDGVRDGAELQVGSDPLDAESLPLLPWREVRSRVDQEDSLVLRTRIGEPRVDLLVLATGASRERCDERGQNCWIWRQYFTRVLRGLLPDLMASRPSLSVGVAVAYHHYFIVRGHGPIRPPFVPIQGVSAQWHSIDRNLHNWPHDSKYQGDGVLRGLFEALTGEGYDQNCDGIYDPERDVRPWISGPTDPFGGRQTGFSSHFAMSGTLPGLGRRHYAMPLVLLGFSPGTSMADPGGPLNLAGDRGPFSGCPREVSSHELASILEDEGGKAILFFPGELQDNHPLRRDFPKVFNAYGDLDGDGLNDDPLILTGDRFDAEWTAENIADDLATIIDAAIASRTFSSVTFEVAGDTHGLVTDLHPKTADVAPETTTDVQVTLRGVVPPQATDQVFELDLVAAGDGKVALGSQPFYVIVPGRGLD